MWLLLFVVVPAYAVLAMATGRVNLLLQPVPAWDPTTWNPGYLSKAFSGAIPGGEYWPAVRNTLVYVAVSLGLCFAIGYPVAYYVARHAKRTKTLLVVLLVIPFWVSYLLRMLAWIGLLSTDGYVNKILMDLGIAHPPNWLDGNAYSVILALVYGYIPYFILPVFAGLDRIDRSQIEAARDLGATPFAGVAEGDAPAQPSCGARRVGAGGAADVRRLLHQRPDLGLAADEHARQRDQPVHPGRAPEEPRRIAGDRADGDPVDRDALLRLPDHPRRPEIRVTATRAPAPAIEPAAAPQPAPRRHLLPARLRNPWGGPASWSRSRGLYVIWALVPVVIAMLFSFNNGRSRSVWQGFSIRWWWGDPSLSIFHDPDYVHALVHSLELAALDMLIAVPLGVLLAIGLARWRGRGSGFANGLMLVPLITPEIVMATSLLLVFTQLALLPFTLVHLGTPAQVIGQVTFSLSYVVVIVRGRLATIGSEYEEAARDLGATPLGSLRLVLLPLLLPAILASMLIVFALSIDDFVVTQYMSSNSSTTTIPMFLYANARGGTTTPALNALATVLVLTTLVGIGIAYLLYTMFGRRASTGDVSVMRELSGLETT